jgi:hypothetical protein
MQLSVTLDTGDALKLDSPFFKLQGGEAYYFEDETTHLKMRISGGYTQWRLAA